MGNVLSQYRKQKPAPKKRPSNTLSDFLTQALQGYWDRQGKLAQEGLTMADQGARQMREGDPAGALGMFAGPANYLMSPVSALVPTGEEIDTARDLPEWSKPLARAASHTALLALPGPDLGPAASAVGSTARRIGDDAAIAFGAEVPEGVTVYGAGPILRKPGLGRGLESLMGDATDTERAALASRLGAESANAGGPVRYKFYVQGKEYTPPAHGTGDIDQSWAAHIAGDPNPLQSIQGRIAQAETPEEIAMWQRIGRKFQTGEFAVLGPDGTPAVGSPRMMPLPQGGYQNAAPSAPPPKSTLRDLMRAGDEPVDVSGYVPDPAARLRVKMPGDDARYDVPSMEEILANQQRDRALLKSPAPLAGGGAGQTPGPAAQVANVRMPLRSAINSASQATFSGRVLEQPMTMKVKDLTGGVRASDPAEIKRVSDLAAQIGGPGGYFERIIVDSSGNVIEGQHRLEALRNLGISDAPVVMLKAADEAVGNKSAALAAARAAGLRPEQAQQIVDNIGEIVARGENPLDYEAPRGFEAAWRAALAAAHTPGPAEGIIAYHGSPHTPKGKKK